MTDTGGTVRSKTPRIWRYEVVQAWGSMVGRVEMGQIILDKWKADRSWFVMNFTTGAEGGWHGKLLGEASPEQAEEVRSKWAAERAHTGRGVS